MKKILNLVVSVILATILPSVANTRVNDYTFHNWSANKLEVTIHSFNGARKCTTTVNPYNGSAQQSTCETTDVHHNIGENCLGKIDIRKIDANGNKTDWHIGEGIAGCDSQQFTIDGNGLPWPGNITPAVKSNSSIQYTVTNNYPYALKAILKTTQAGCCNGSNCSFTVGAHSAFTYTTPLWQGSNSTLLCAGACMHNLTITLVDAAGNPLKFDSQGRFNPNGQVYTWTLSNAGSECQSKTIEISPSSSNSTIGSASIRNTSDKPETTLKTFGQFIGEFAWEALEALGHE